MTDPSDALRSFQQAFAQGGMDLQRGTLDPVLYLYVDAPTGKTRFTYAKAERLVVTALAIFAAVDLTNGMPVFQVGYAVSPKFQGQGRAKDIVAAGIAEMRYGFTRTPMQAFVVEAVVGIDNPASQRVAEQVISAHRSAITDSVSGLAAFRYERTVEVRPA